MRNIIGSLQALSILHVGVAYACNPQDHPAVTTKNGTLVGIRNPYYDQDFFLGIPFAQPPVGKLRLNRPQPVNETWKQRAAIAYAPRCLSNPIDLPLFSQNGFSHEESEDCLYLNIVRPTCIDDSDRLPVMTWIHGGGFEEGGSGDQRYNQSFLVHESIKMGKPIIGVSITYRLNGFGFLGGSAVNTSGIGNLGFQDQKLALHWIQENIAEFGGDPLRVTIHGVSAGAYSVGAHFVANGGRDDGLFHAGIAQSGSAMLPSTFLSLAEQDLHYEKIISKANCSSATNSLDCLRDLDTKALKAAFVGGYFRPVPDADFITGSSPSAPLKDGNFVKRPLLIGTNMLEGTAFLQASEFVVNTEDDFRTYITGAEGYLNGSVDRIVDEYVNKWGDEQIQYELGTVLQSPGPEYGLLYGNAALYQGDTLFDGRRRFVTEAWGKYGADTYSFRFNVPGTGVDSKTLGATHSVEMPFIFRNVDGIGYEVNRLAANSTIIRERYLEISNLISRMWISFANHGSPNYHGGKSFLVPERWMCTNQAQCLPLT